MEPYGDPKGQRLAVVGVDLGFKTHDAGGTRALDDHLDRRPSDAGPALFRDDRELGDAPAIVSDADQAEADNLTASLDQQGHAIGHCPVRVEVGVRVCPPIELEQVIGEEPTEQLAIVEACFAQRHCHGRILRGHWPQLRNRTLAQASIRQCTQSGRRIQQMGKPEWSEDWSGRGVDWRDTSKDERMAKDWIQNERLHSPAATAEQRIPDGYSLDLDDRVRELVLTDLDPERGWRLVLTLLRLAEDDAALTNVALGPLETFVTNHRDQFHGQIRRQAREDARFRQALSKTLTGWTALRH